MNHERHEHHEKIIYKDECYAIEGAIFEVYREMGHEFLEAVYQECLLKAFQDKQIPFESQSMLRLLYKEQPLEQVYRPDFVC